MHRTAPNVAILSPSKDAYSETFIEAHKRTLAGTVRYYYGTRDAQSLDGVGRLLGGFARYAGKAAGKLRGRPGLADDRALLRSWKDNGIDVILAEYGTTAAEYLDVIEMSRLPLVVHFHGFDASMHAVLRANEERYRRMFAYASYVVVVSSVMREKLVALGCPADKLVLNISGPDPSFHQLVPTFARRQFVAVGRFTEKKAPYHTVAAFARVLDTFPDARLVMAGSGELLDRCKALVGQYGINASVAFPGIITREQFIAYLEESLAFVQHSITADSGDMEGTPLTVLESSAAGLPVVSTLHAGIPDVIEHEETGFLVAEHDVEAMAVHMARLLGDPHLAREMGAKGRLKIARQFSLKRHIDALDELLASAAMSGVDIAVRSRSGTN